MAEKNPTADSAGKNFTLPGTKVMLQGATGAGKTHAIRTLVDAGLEVFILFTEPAMELVEDLSTDKVHYAYVPPASVSFADMMESARKINTMSMKALASLDGVNKQLHNQFYTLLSACANFVCDRTGESFGNIDDWGPERVLVVDSLSGLNIMAMDLVTGSKPVKAMADWGIAMDNLERFVNHLCMVSRCHFVLTAHLEREHDEVTGGVHLMASTLGRKLAPRLPRYFSDVILTRKEDKEWWWSTSSPNIDLKARNIPYSDKLPPTFVPLINGWRKKQGLSPVEPK